MVCVCILCTAICMPMLNINWENNSDSNAEVETPVIVPDIPDEEDNTVTVTVPSFNNAVSAWNYAIGILNGGKAYYVESSTAANGSVYGVSQTQEIAFTAMFDGESYYEDTKTYCASSIGKTFARQTYRHKGGDVYYRYTENIDKSGGSANNSVANWKENDTKIISYEQFLNDISTVGFKLFSFNVDKSSVVYFKNMNKDYYEYQLAISQSMIHEDYKLNFMRNADASAINIKSCVVTVYQSKTTGKFIQIKKEENYVLSSPLGLPVDLETNSTSLYKNFKMGLDTISIPHPFDIQD